MKYKEYLDKLDELFLAQYDLIGINNDEICGQLESFLDILDKKDWKKFQNDFTAYQELIKLYENVVVKEIDSVPDKNQLSIKKTLLIIKQLVQLLYGSVMILKDVINEINSTLKTKTAFKKMKHGIDHYLEIYDKAQQLIKELNIQYSEDITNMQFDLSLITDKVQDSLDFDKILIPYNWVFLLPH